MLGNIVEVADISIAIPSNGADNETRQFVCSGPCLCRGALDHQRNSVVGRQKVRLESALEHRVPEPQRDLPEVRRHEARTFVTSPGIVNEDMQPPLMIESAAAK